MYQEVINAGSGGETATTDTTIFVYGKEADGYHFDANGTFSVSPTIKNGVVNATTKNGSAASITYLVDVTDYNYIDIVSGGSDANILVVMLDEDYSNQIEKSRGVYDTVLTYDVSAIKGKKRFGVLGANGRVINLKYLRLYK